MTIRLAGEQDKHKLDFAARNVYTLPNEEYRVLPSSARDGDYILEVKTIRSIDPIVRVVVADNMLFARVSLYPAINSTKKISVQQIVFMLTEKHKVTHGCIDEAALHDAVNQLNEGYIVEGVMACKGTPPVNGKNAVIEYLFERPNVKPKLLPNGKVDYKITGYDADVHLERSC